MSENSYQQAATCGSSRFWRFGSEGDLTNRALDGHCDRRASRIGRQTDCRDAIGYSRQVGKLEVCSPRPNAASPGVVIAQERSQPCCALLAVGRRDAAIGPLAQTGLDESLEVLTDVQRAARFFYLQQQAFGGRVQGQTWGTATTAPAISLLRIEENLSAAHLRLASAYI